MTPRAKALRQARNLRRAGAIVLLLGLFGAELLYWMRTRSLDSSDLLPVAGEDKGATRQAQMMMGQQAVLMEEWGRDLQRPGTQAVLVAVTAALAAGGCFYFAGLLGRASRDSDQTGPSQS